MSYVDDLRERAKNVKSIVCMGIDPVIEKIPIKGEPRQVIEGFYLDILKEMNKRDSYPAVIKPNIAYFEQYGFDGLNALKTIISRYKSSGIPTLLDAKRGDIGKTSTAYAKSAYEFWDSDAVTIAPYMGSDSVEPFIQWCEKGKGVYILCRTSNKGAADLQDLKVDGVPIYMKLAENILKWHKPGVGAVVGATYIEELEEISRFFVESKKEVPLLIPGVGSQGGSAGEVVEVLKKTSNDILIHRINSSSGINYAYIEKDTSDYAAAAIDALETLNKEIGALV
ncbi:MAG: orotidine-5'-phosphate decarboxylase [Candidatus Scalindua rubra]|uniref:Orotidine-5'-phosphate decarboxylase n=1 Tax=Candidatus Scalindua brodae TaxID=237368 RepID=A0A0B0ERE2_9BACT|nr:MAG: orotidine 5'-phosphate decarboxylase [Candidatus Scalindua brodae]MBZ0108044.1 orotidine-5'-phosphate decarboxylase [Candidatus Scalindua rubra]TWU33941.1 orotidine 5'-phosphate decarboxylase [Candidatus Brocadiaceae bacterium S225]